MKGEREFTVGQWITYSRTSQRGDTLNFSTRRAKVLQVGKSKLLIKVRGGCIWINKSNARHENERSALGDAVLGICEAVVAAEVKNEEQP